MALFPVGKPTDAIVQIAYAVPDLQAAIGWWVEHLGVGPWYVAERMGGEGTTYRGQPSRAEFSIAIAFSGRMMFELIEALDDEPSVYKERRERTGYGFHHLAKLRPNVRQLAEDYVAKGGSIVFQAPVPGGEVFYVEAGKDAPGFIELIEDSALSRHTFEEMWRASVDWDGERPVRSVAEFLERV